MKNLFFLPIVLFSCTSLPPRVKTQKLKEAGKFSSVSLLPGHTKKQHESFSQNLMIATQGVHSTQAGLRMIELGGNAFDAAAAVSFAISVERPQSTGIGGGGFMLLDGPGFSSPKALDFREKAPLKSSKTMYLDSKGNPINHLPIDGILASGVPGLVKGVLEVQQKYGKLTRKQILAPAIELAEKGFAVYPHLAKALEARKSVLEKFPATKKIFFRNGSPLKEGDQLIQKDLGKTLRAIAQKGSDAFYKGSIADAIAKEFKNLGGLITKNDLEIYHTKWRKPIEGNFKNYQVYSMSPPSSGGTHIVEILNILEPLKLYEQGVQSPKTIHQTATAMQLAFVDRARYMGDSDFVKIPLKTLTSKEYASQLRSKITDKALVLTPKDLTDAFAYESDETTHFTIADKEGNIVSSTQTINGWMGSGVVVSGTGIVMNNEMDDFSKKAGDSNLFGAVGSENNLVEPQKRPLSSMSPTLVKHKGKTILALGTPSGTRILTCVAQVLLNYLEHRLGLWDSVAATRYHHQWKPDQLRIGSPGFSLQTMIELQKKGHTIDSRDLGCQVQAVALEKDGLHGVSDPRGEGLAKGI